MEESALSYLQLCEVPSKNLKTMAKELGIAGVEKMKKSQMIRAILQHHLSKQGLALSEGTLEITPEGYGFLRTRSYVQNDDDVYVSPSQIKRYGLMTGDTVIAQVRLPKDDESYHSLLKIEAVNDLPVEALSKRTNFENGIPIFPRERFRLETPDNDISVRVFDLICPIGKGQRGLIVAPPKAGKTTLLKHLANAIITNHPEVLMLILLIDERPEEVTDMRRSVDAEVVASTFDEHISHHIKVSELLLEKAKRHVELGRDVVILLDSITRLARAYNISVPSAGQTLTGGVNPFALHKPKRFLGAARKIEGGGSLTVIATALVDTGSKMDEVIFEEFKGTGNMELHLDRKLFNKRIFPCIDVKLSGTRKEELLMPPEDLNKVIILRRAFEEKNPQEVVEMLVKSISATKTNAEFLAMINPNYKPAGKNTAG
ncbi:MAG: Transcription termination factor Rho [Candidatus Ozemobacter sibiricus]|uniref:Transcription termination factor Rho n=1 Tax=Candidatus Ozemobacter sibiricus TaxID=2268124 RepID=A0A367ZGP7_9BACT|nr:MAG: Transcription termination factor Rho [Candidatus Ozemobacter sibiricus]